MEAAMSAESAQTASTEDSYAHTERIGFGLLLVGVAARLMVDVS
jgi:hypothetical protein